MSSIAFLARINMRIRFTGISADTITDRCVILTGTNQIVDSGAIRVTVVMSFVTKIMLTRM
eukprot:3893466-Pyramimonas_sp.AAC.1